jgi:hypothetical protein
VSLRCRARWGLNFEFTKGPRLFTVAAFPSAMRVLLFLSLLTSLFCAGCNNQYGDDPAKQGLPTPAATPVPTATPIEKAE